MGMDEQAQVSRSSMGRSSADGLQRHVHLGFLRKYAVVFVLLALILVFSLVSDSFFTVRNLTNIVTQNTYFIIVAVGLSFVLIAGGIDLSVGYQMSLVGVVTAMMMVLWSFPVWAAVVLGLALGTVLGLVNGLIVARIKTFPLIVTLATSVIFQGISYIVSQARTFRDFPSAFQFIAKGRLGGVPLDVWLTLLIVVVVALIYYQTKWGMRVVALGGNEEALRLAGVSTRRTKTWVYMACGFLTAVATMVMVSKANSVQSSFGPGTEFTALTAAIVGGVSFLGGEGNIPALVAGVFVLAVLGNGMQLAGWGVYAQFIVRGAILLAAVAFDEYQKSLKLRVKA
ncbi:MAG: ABC transporter permease [Actinomycetia bacterium]|nr:ABC transporter permease [Actinomycetes bacterium]